MSFFGTTRRSVLLLFAGFLGVSWAVLINHLQLMWSSDPQYRYGWAVPVLCLGLMIRKTTVPEAGAAPISLRPGWILFGITVLALIYPPTRLIQAANPDWRLMSWALALEVVGLTLLLVYLVFGARWLRRLAFPIGFFLVAVPWPTFLEKSVIQGLTNADTGTAVELLDWLGVSALQHGNIIEVATGNVGVDEACSGIRSLQATLMISLFLGESYQLTFARRLGLLAGGFALSFVFNLTRMCLLTWVAVHQGIGAIKQWHDPTGNTILLACCLALWGLGVLLARRQKSARPIANLTVPTIAGRKNNFVPANRALTPLLGALLAWFVVAEGGVEFWYRWHEAHLPPARQWTVAWPTNNPTFKTVVLSDQAAELLRYDEGQSVAWKTGGLEWQGIFLRWNPRQRALVYAKLHTPDVCLTAAGHPATKGAETVWVAAGGLRLPFAVYTVASTQRPMHVFYCLWSDRALARDRNRMPRTFDDRWEPVWAGVRNAGHRSLEIAITGNLDEKAAESALRQELAQIIQDH
jgi:exosortase